MEQTWENTGTEASQPSVGAVHCVWNVQSEKGAGQFSAAGGISAGRWVSYSGLWLPVSWPALAIDPSSRTWFLSAHFPFLSYTN